MQLKSFDEVGSISSTPIGGGLLRDERRQNDRSVVIQLVPHVEVLDGGWHVDAVEQRVVEDVDRIHSPVTGVLCTVTVPPVERQRVQSGAKRAEEI
jgi:hypothetical protein